MSEQPFRRRLVRCPNCGGESVYATSNPDRPFCSPRCRNNDFGAWASDAYGVEAKPGENEEREPDAMG
jgi:hypothetical protein